ncbi:MAG: DNA polymerase III subunit delta [Victivallaceae bacterium]
MAKFYLISGNDEFAIKTKAKEIICSLCGDPPENNPDLEIVNGDSDEMKPEEILAELLSCLKTPPFLCPDKKICLRHFMHFEKVFAAAAKDSITVLAEALIEFIKQGLPDDITLIVDGPELDQRKAFFKACKTAGAEIHYFRKADISSKDYVKTQYVRIDEICEKARKHIEQQAKDYLAETAGSDSARLKSELDKLFCYVGKKANITLEDCKAICSRTPEAMGWDFANLLISRDVTGALTIVGDLMEQMRSQRGSGSHELAILSSAVRSFQEMVKVKTAVAELNVPRRVGKSFFYSLDPALKEKFPDNILLNVHPFRAYMMYENSQSFTDRDLAGALESILDANRGLVSGGGDSRIILEQLVLKIAGK